MALRVHNLDHDTHPCVLHHGGGDKLCRSGLEIKRQCFDLIGDPRRTFYFSKSGRISDLRVYRRPVAREPLRRLPNLAVVTFTNLRPPGSAELSLAHLGIPMDVVRPRGVRKWNHLLKIQLMKVYLESVATDYVLFMDSHDAFVTSDLLGVVDLFRKMECKLLFQADALDWPRYQTEFYDRIAPRDAKYRYLCSGIFMGETEFLKRVVEEACRTEPIGDFGDQAIYKQVFPRFYPEIRIDHHCEIFQPLTDYRDLGRPGRYEPVDLKLEIQFRPDPPTPRAVVAAPRRGAATIARHLLDRLSSL